MNFIKCNKIGPQHKLVLYSLVFLTGVIDLFQSSHSVTFHRKILEGVHQKRIEEERGEGRGDRTV